MSACRNAAEIRSLLSRTEVSGRPTRVICGYPDETTTWTSTGIASTPCSANVRTTECIGGVSFRVRWREARQVGDVAPQGDLRDGLRRPPAFPQPPGVDHPSCKEIDA